MQRKSIPSVLFQKRFQKVRITDLHLFIIGDFVAVLRCQDIGNDMEGSQHLLLPSLKCMHFFTVKVSGPTGHFTGYLLVNTACDFELNLSEHKAKQIGIWKDLNKSDVETGETLSISMTNRYSTTIFSELFQMIQLCPSGTTSSLA